MERRLAAIVAADVVGFSRLVRDDEDGALAAMASARRELIEPLVTENRGRIVKLMGDGLLIEFHSAVEAVRCAVAWQENIGDRAKDVPISFRIGINLGDIVVDTDDILGDGVNTVSRLEGLSRPSGICVSGPTETLAFRGPRWGRASSASWPQPADDLVSAVTPERDAGQTPHERCPKQSGSVRWRSAGVVKSE